MSFSKPNSLSSNPRHTDLFCKLCLDILSSQFLQQANYKIRLWFRNYFSFPARSPPPHILPISKLILESCNKGCNKAASFICTRKNNHYSASDLHWFSGLILIFNFWGLFFKEKQQLTCYVKGKPSWVFFRKLPSKARRLPLHFWALTAHTATAGCSGI